MRRALSGFVYTNLWRRRGSMSGNIFGHARGAYEAMDKAETPSHSPTAACVQLYESRPQGPFSIIPVRLASYYLTERRQSASCLLGAGDCHPLVKVPSSARTPGLARESSNPHK